MHLTVLPKGFEALFVIAFRCYVNLPWSTASQHRVQRGACGEDIRLLIEDTYHRLFGVVEHIQIVRVELHDTRTWGAGMTQVDNHRLALHRHVQHDVSRCDIVVTQRRRLRMHVLQTR